MRNVHPRSASLPRLVIFGVLLLAMSCRLAEPDDLFISTTTEVVPPSDLAMSESRTDGYPVRYYHSLYNISLEPPLGWVVEEVNGPLVLTTMVDPGGEVRIMLTRRDANGTRSAVEAHEAFIEEWFSGFSLRVYGRDEFKTAQGISGWMSNGRADSLVDAETREEDWAIVSLFQEDTVYHLSLISPEHLFKEMKEAFLSAAYSLRFDPDQPIEIPREAALYLSSGEPTTLDPALTHYGSSGIIGDLYSGLVALDPHMQVRPSLAIRWEVNDRGTLYIFYLHPNARFHNGRPVTAHDVLFSWERAANPLTGSETVLLYMGGIVGLEEFHAGMSENIAGVDVLDEHTLQVQIKEPVPYFLAQLTYPVAWVVDRYNVDLPNWELHPNGTGPFRYLQHLKDEVFILEQNPFYYAEPPRLKYVVYRMYSGYTQSLYERGEVDFTGLSRDQLERAMDPSDGLHGTLFDETGLCTYYVTFNTTLPPFDDPNVRRAFVHAVDRELYVEAITEGEAPIGRGVLPPGMPGYSDKIAPPAYDPDLARSLLATSSYYDGSQDPPRIVWTLPTSGGYYSPGAALLVDMWEETLGVTVTVEGVEWDSYNDQIDAGLYGQLLKEGWCADYPDPENFLEVLFHSRSAQNHAHYNNPDFDKLVEEARSEQDIERRLTLYQEAEQLVLDEAPIIILNHNAPSYGVWKPYVKGYIPSPIGVPQHASMWIKR